MKPMRVVEAASRDVGHGIVRLDPRDIVELGGEVGEVVQIKGKRATVGKLMPCLPPERSKEIVQLDGLLRENAQVAVGETVELEKVTVRPAEKVLLAPLSVGAGLRDGRELGGLLESIPVVEGDRVRATLFGTQGKDFRVVKTWPAGAVQIHGKTTVELQVRESAEGGKGPRISYEDIGGIRKEIGRIREMIELPLRYPELFERLGIEPPKGVLIHGPPGCGKTLIARAVANETEAYFTHISGPQIIHKFYGESEEHLRQVFQEAQRRAPAIIFLDELDAIAPKREGLGDEKQVERRVVAQLLALMDGIESRGHVIVIGATNLPNTLDPALRRPGRFDREISIPIPDQQGRREILEIHTRGMPLAEDVSLDRLAQITHGFVGADLAALGREAAMRCLRRVLPQFDLSRDEIPIDVIKKLHITADDFRDALKDVEPSALREFYVEVPNVRWADVGGLTEAKARLREAVEWPLKHPELFKRAGLRPPKGILLSGPPGTGKTLLAKAVATETEVNFIAVRGAEVYSKYVGESERTIREIFRRARQAAPCVIFLDELDTLAPARNAAVESMVTERVLGQLLAEMDGLLELRGVIVIGATNRRDVIDAALLRPGRFDWSIEIPEPNEFDRLEILKVHTREMPLGSGVDLTLIARETKGMVGAELESVCREAAMQAVRDAVGAGGQKAVARLVITKAHFERALEDVRKGRQ